MSREGLLLDLGFRDYKETWDIQLSLVDLRAENLIPDALILVEHPHVVTLGRRGRRENVLSQGLPVYEIERGGDATYHGPGQLVGYPIVKLDERKLDLHQYLRDLEAVLIRALRDLGVDGERVQGHTGVWRKGRKIASIGVAVRRWVAFHGFALNANTDLRYFRLIHPCGLDASVMTSMREVLGRSVDFELLKQRALARFEEVFAIKLRAVSVDSLPPKRAAELQPPPPSETR